MMKDILEQRISSLKIDCKAYFKKISIKFFMTMKGRSPALPRIPCPSVQNNKTALLSRFV